MQKLFADATALKMHEQIFLTLASQYSTWNQKTNQHFLQNMRNFPRFRCDELLFSALILVSNHILILLNVQWIYCNFGSSLFFFLCFAVNISYQGLQEQQQQQKHTLRMCISSFMLWFHVVLRYHLRHSRLWSVRNEMHFLDCNSDESNTSTKLWCNQTNTIAQFSCGRSYTNRKIGFIYTSALTATHKHTHRKRIY